MKIKKEIFTASAILISGFFASSVILAQAQTAVSGNVQPETVASGSTQVAPNAQQGITFPVAGLGNCSNKEECRSYCNQPANMDACIAFAKSHGLMNKEEADRAGNFRNILQSSGGPGGCKGPEECKSFCSDIKNLDACISFAKKNNLGTDDQEISKAEKILSFVKNGGQMPGGCTSKESCQAYCGDFSHAEECFNFAKNAGINQGSGGGEGPEGDIPPGQFQKFLELAKNGQTPGGCKSKDQCENYCKDQSHTDECVKFGQQIGAISPEQADRIQKLGGKGPGGCASQESCSAYCNDPSHRDECFKFAEENGFIQKDKVEQMKKGMTQMMMGLSQMPPEVARCVQSTIGVSNVEDIQSSQIVPGPEIGDKIHECFDKFGQRENIHGAFQKIDMPDAVKSCLQQKLGDKFSDIVSGQKQPSPEDAQALRVCFEQDRIDNGNSKEDQGDNGARVGEFLRSAPPEVSKCVSGKLGDSFDKISSGQEQASTSDIQKIKDCFNSFRPQNNQNQNGERMMREGDSQNEFQNGQQMNRPGENDSNPRGSMMQKFDIGNLPPAVSDCVKSISGNSGNGENTSDLRENIGKCFQQIQGQPGSSSSGTFPQRQFLMPRNSGDGENEFNKGENNFPSNTNPSFRPDGQNPSFGGKQNFPQLQTGTINPGTPFQPGTQPPNQPTTQFVPTLQPAPAPQPITAPQSAPVPPPVN